MLQVAIDAKNIRRGECAMVRADDNVTCFEVLITRSSSTKRLQAALLNLFPRYPLPLPEDKTSFWFYLK
jgi:hypothetical protein